VAAIPPLPLAWSHDGKQVIFTMKGRSDKHLQLYAKDAEAKKPAARIAWQPADADNCDLVFSPDGKQLAYISGDLQGDISSPSAGEEEEPVLTIEN
jgi:Tol biopolymer transport system component